LKKHKVSHLSHCQRQKRKIFNGLVDETVANIRFCIFVQVCVFTDTF